MLQLRNVTFPDGRHAACARAYATAESAARHLAYHVLEAPEMDKWCLIEPRFDLYLQNDRDIVRWRRLALERPSSDELQPLYDIYCNSVAQEMRDARYLQWYATEFPQSSVTTQARPGPRTAVCVGFGTSGVLGVFEYVGDKWALRTAFIAGAGRPERVRIRNIPVQVGATVPAGASVGRSYNSRAVQRCRGYMQQRDERKQRQRHERFSPLQRIYFEVFRPALQFIFRQQLISVRPDGRVERRDYSLLKEVLPPRKRMKYDTWLELRRQCRELAGAPKS
ncbi:MAG: hypothetical protein RMJ82_01380 [Gemmatales bacterium]|nr:hypothetical protein [Gemmatales bacterium]